MCNSQIDTIKAKYPGIDSEDLGVLNDNYPGMYVEYEELTKKAEDAYSEYFDVEKRMNQIGGALYNEINSDVYQLSAKGQHEQENLKMVPGFNNVAVKKGSNLKQVEDSKEYILSERFILVEGDDLSSLLKKSLNTLREKISDLEGASKRIAALIEK